MCGICAVLRTIITREIQLVNRIPGHKFIRELVVFSSQRIGLDFGLLTIVQF